ncbi:hypothetical protein DQM68_09770 [Leptospira mayottensis]|uniref:Uncharacterized protein n=2 Tax=Leptospira mayottensis TaxID=1137606 RepID=A0AA87MRF3_9LEPT|nr:hypothetical protein DQM68_09770 [Leptospira mayottensis]AXR64799.1 hypothetical protein DQM28_11810 [Leptospira mayottensis]AZQ02640.1 hypothetical protein LEP1GSC190_11925 [Leptospira mayottensis 200901116]EKS00407.1 hypothetical protein LEP1GSC125_2312 [Leptospira mayottensis 200901122]TGN12028.1 hypothetical protein EHR03_06055 [Leptospira mayottensis]
MEIGSITYLKALKEINYNHFSKFIIKRHHVKRFKRSSLFLNAYRSFYNPRFWDRFLFEKFF